MFYTTSRGRGKKAIEMALRQPRIGIDPPPGSMPTMSGLLPVDGQFEADGGAASGLSAGDSARL
jgi:hypothetical protein